MVVDGLSLAGHLSVVNIVGPFFTIIVWLGYFIIYRFLIDPEEVIVDMCSVTVFENVRKVVKLVVNGCCRSIAIECFIRIRNYGADHTPGPVDAKPVASESGFIKRPDLHAVSFRFIVGGKWVVLFSFGNGIMSQSNRVCHRQVFSDCILRKLLETDRTTLSLCAKSIFVFLILLNVSSCLCSLGQSYVPVRRRRLLQNSRWCCWRDRAASTTIGSWAAYC